MTIPAELLDVAKRVVWFQPPEETIEDRTHFLCYLMQYGSLQDVVTTRKYYTNNDFQDALINAYPGIMGRRSWAYWNLIINGQPFRPMPTRQLE